MPKAVACPLHSSPGASAPSSRMWRCPAQPHRPRQIGFVPPNVAQHPQGESRRFRPSSRIQITDSGQGWASPRRVRQRRSQSLCRCPNAVNEFLSTAPQSCIPIGNSHIDGMNSSYSILRSTGRYIVLVTRENGTREWSPWFDMKANAQAWIVKQTMGLG